MTCFIRVGKFAEVITFMNLVLWLPASKKLLGRTGKLSYLTINNYGERKNQTTLLRIVRLYTCLCDSYDRTF